MGGRSGSQQWREFSLSSAQGGEITLGFYLYLRHSLLAFLRSSPSSQRLCSLPPLPEVSISPLLVQPRARLQETGPEGLLEA